MLTPSPDPRAIEHYPNGSPNFIRTEVIDLGTHKIARVYMALGGRDQAYIDYDYMQLEALIAYLGDAFESLRVSPRSR